MTCTSALRTAAFLTLAFILVLAPRVATAQGVVTSDGMFPVAVVLPSAAGPFAIIGTLHVVSSVSLPDATVDVHANLLDTTGTNLSSGATAEFRFSTLGTLEGSDIGAATFLVLFEASEAAQEDLQAVMQLRFDRITGRLLNASITSDCGDLCG